MAKVQFDCELMLQPMPEMTLTDADNFHVLQSTGNNPVLICTGADQALIMIAPDELGHNQVISLSERFCISGKVNAVAVTQDHADSSKVYMAVASQARPNEPSQINILRPFQIGRGTWWESIDWPSLVIRQVENSFEIHRLLLAARCDKGASYPFIAAERSLPGVSKHNVSRITVDLQTGQWKWSDHELSLPYDVSKVDDLCVASSVKSSGIMFMDRTQDIPTVTFTNLKGAGQASVFLRLPILPNPRSIAILTDRYGCSDVLISGDGGILHVPAQDWATSVPIRTTKPPTLIDNAFEGAHELRVAQTGQTATIWAINSNGNVVDQSVELQPRSNDEGVDDLCPVKPAVALFPTGNGIRHFESTLDRSTGSQQLFALRMDGSVACFTQAGDSSLWTASELLIPNPEDIRDVNTYTCHIRCFGNSGTALANAEVQISTSSQARVAVNGEIMYLSQKPNSVKTDEQGDLTVIFPANDLCVPTLTISGSDIPSTSLQPAENALKKLAAKARTGAMKDAKDKEGNPIFPLWTDDAVNAIDQIHDTFGNGNEKPDPEATRFKPSDAESDWSFWHGLVSGVEDFLGFSYEVGRIIIRTAKRAWTFIINTAEQALKAISGLFNWLGAKLEDALTWLAEQLDWETILDVQLFFKSLFTTGLDCTEDLLHMGSKKIDEWMAAVEEEVSSWHTPLRLPDSIANQKLKVNNDEVKQESGHMNIPLSKWVDSKLQDKQVRKSTEQGNMHGENAQAATLAQLATTFFEQVLKTLWETLKESCTHIWEDVKGLFEPGSTLSVGEALKNVGVDVLLAIVKCVRKGTQGIVAVIFQLLRWIRSILNEELDIWVLTKVYKKVTGGQPLTVLNLATLFLAVPTSFMFKVVTMGKRPKDIPAMASLLSEIRTKNESSGAATGLSNSASGGLFMNSFLVDSAVSPLAVPSVPRNSTSISNSPNINRAAFNPSSNTLSTPNYFAPRALAPGPPPPNSFAINSISENKVVRSSVLTETRPMSSSKAGHVVNIADSKPEKTPVHPDEAVKKIIDTNPNFAWLIKLYREGMVWVSCGLACWTPIDCLKTGIFWPTALTPAKPPTNCLLQIWQKITPTIGFMAWIMSTLGSFPFSKSNSKREPVGRLYRWCLSIGKGYANFMKLGLPDHMRPPLNSLIAQVDLAVYIWTLLTECVGEETDTIYEILMRILEDGWAIGGSLNCLWECTEPITLTLTISAGLVMSGANLYQANAQWEYYKAHKDDSEFEYPSWANSMTGSLW
ncbi:hypothetical protein FSHL1_006754 [Fusarium sambucinum]